MVNRREKYSLPIKFYRKIPTYKKYLHNFRVIGVTRSIVKNKGVNLNMGVLRAYY